MSHLQVTRESITRQTAKDACDRQTLVKIPVHDGVISFIPAEVEDFSLNDPPIAYFRVSGEIPGETPGSKRAVSYVGDNAGQLAGVLSVVRPVARYEKTARGYVLTTAESGPVTL